VEDIRKRKGLTKEKGGYQGDLHWGEETGMKPSQEEKTPKEHAKQRGQERGLREGQIHRRAQTPEAKKRT